MNKFLSLFVLIFVFTACKKENEMPPQQAMPYPVVEVEQRDLTSFLEFPAQIQGVNNNEVRAKIQGYITQVLVDEGQYVGRGQVLFRLETNTLSQTASAARAGIEATQANIKAAQAAVNAAQVEVDKLQPLVEKNIISPVQLETANANLMRAQSQLSQARAAHSQSNANLKEVQANIGYSVIRSPISGVVGKINQREGSLVGPSSSIPITTVSETSAVYAYFSMNESEYLDFLDQNEGANPEQKLKNMPEVDLRLANGKVYAEKGKIEAVTGQIDPNSGTVQFRASFKNPEKVLSNGNSGTILIPQYYKNAIVVPQQATFEQQGITYVFKVVNDTVRSTSIETQTAVDKLSIVTSGLKPGDPVVASGVGILRNGSAIKAQPVKLDSIVKPSGK
ncbi:MAG: efflux RND transporter periplasmic adaptor subunit [Flavobacteriaceae bacterium]|nr:efflux RND transporter periplasmic adaptor subunit [Flavobacteriaceae bacterium]